MSYILDHNMSHQNARLTNWIVCIVAGHNTFFIVRIAHSPRSVIAETHRS